MKKMQLILKCWKLHNILSLLSTILTLHQWFHCRNMSFLCNFLSSFNTYTAHEDGKRGLNTGHKYFPLTCSSSNNLVHCNHFINGSICISKKAFPDIFFIFIQLQLSVFSPHPSTPPQPVPPPSPTSTLPLDFVLVSLIVAPIDPSPHYPLPTPLWLLLQCS